MTSPANAIVSLEDAMTLNLPVIMMGAPGVGKSDCARQAAVNYLDVKEIADLKLDGANRNFIDLRASLLDPVDVHGLPTVDKEEMVARWAPMGLLPREGHDAEFGILFIDELTNAPKSVQGALYGLVLDRRVGEYRVPAGWRIVAAGNRVEDRAAAGRLASALANRFVHLEVEPTVDDWIKWAIEYGVAPELVAFMRFRPELLNDFDPDRTINATPRTWKMVADIVAAKLPEDRETRLIYAAVGDGPGAEVCAFLKVWRELPNPDAVLMNPEGAEIPENSAGKYAISGALARRVKEESLEAMITYMNRLPAEFGVMAIRDATTRDTALTATTAFINWAQANQDYYL